MSLWDVRDVRKPEKVAEEGEDNHVFSPITFSSDGRWLATIGGGGGGRVELWRPESLAKQASLRGHASHVNALSFAPGGEFLASGSHDQTARVWRTPSR